MSVAHVLYVHLPINVRVMIRFLFYFILFFFSPTYLTILLLKSFSASINFHYVGTYHQLYEWPFQYTILTYARTPGEL